MKRDKKIVEATIKEQVKLQEFFFPSVWVTIKAETLEEAKEKLKNIS